MPPSSTNQPPASRPQKRGGRRPGAGAPRGNLNALKHGRRSEQFAQLGALLASIPQTRDALLQLARRHKLKQRRAEQVAALLFGRLLQRARQVTEGRLNAQPAIHERRSIKPDRAAPDTPDPATKQTRSQTIKPKPNAANTIKLQIRDPP